MAVFKKKKRIEIILEKTLRETPTAFRGDLTDEKTPGAGVPLDASSPYRLRKDATGIEFYDMGRVKQLDGTFADNTFAYPGVISKAFLQNTYFGYRLNSLPAAGRTAFNDALLTDPGIVPPADYYQKIEYLDSDFLYLDAEFYNSATDRLKIPFVTSDSARRFVDTTQSAPLAAASEYWTENGLKLPAGFNKEKLRIKAYQFFERFDTGDLTNYKLTNLPNYAAPPAENLNLSGSAKIKIFLVPKLFAEVPEQSNSYGSKSVVVWANFCFVPAPRFFKFVTRYDWAPYIYQPPGELGYAYPAAPAYDAYSTDLKNKITDLIYSRPAARAISNYYDPEVPTDEITTVPLSQFASELLRPGPIDPAYAKGRAYLFGQFIPHSLDGTNTTTVPIEGSLVGIIQKKGVNFYIWRKTTASPSGYVPTGQSGTVEYDMILSLDVRSWSTENPYGVDQWNLRP